MQSFPAFPAERVSTSQCGPYFIGEDFPVQGSGLGTSNKGMACRIDGSLKTCSASNRTSYICRSEAQWTKSPPTVIPRQEP